MYKKEKEILENVKLKIAISEFYEEERKNMKSTRKNVFKVVAVACSIIILITGGVFAKDIGNFIKNLFGANTSDGVDIAINNGYLLEIQTETQSAEGIEISVDSLIMDDFNFAMNFRVTLDEKYDIDEFEWAELEDLKIVDETGKIVFDTHTMDMQGKSIEEIEKEGHYQGGYSFLPEKISDNQFKLSLAATGNPELFPKSKHLSIQFTKIRISRYDEEKQMPHYKYYEGNWNFEVDVPEEFYKRETIIYKVKNCNDEKTQLTKAILSNTAFRIEMTTTTDKIDYELIHTQNPKSIYDIIPLQKEYVETSDGKRFEPSARSDGDGGSSLSPENVIDYYQTFNLTTYDATDEITVHIFTNKGEEIIIELER